MIDKSCPQKLHSLAVSFTLASHLGHLIDIVPPICITTFLWHPVSILSLYRSHLLSCYYKRRLPLFQCPNLAEILQVLHQNLTSHRNLHFFLLFSCTYNNTQFLPKKQVGNIGKIRQYKWRYKKDVENKVFINIDRKIVNAKKIYIDFCFRNETYTVVLKDDYYKESEETNLSDNGEEIILETKLKNGNKYIAYKKLYINKCLLKRFAAHFI